MSHAEDLCLVLPPVNNLEIEIDFHAHNKTMKFEPPTQLAKISLSFMLLQVPV